MRKSCCDPLDINSDGYLPEELKRVCPTYECGDGQLPVDTSYRIFQRSSFKLIYLFTEEIVEANPEIVNPRDYDFVFTYSILDQSDIFVASHIQGNSTNLFINDKDKSITVVFENPGFDIGKLMAEYRFISKDQDFIFNKSSVFFGEWTGVKIIDDVTKATKPENFVTKMFNSPSFPLSLIMKIK